MMRDPGTVETDAVIRPAGPGDLAGMLDLLSAADLPAAGVAEWLPHYFVAEHGGRLVGAAGLELYETSALLRSVVVAESWRGRGLGGALVGHAIEAARVEGVTDIYLLTETADRYFPKFGFQRIERADVPAPVRESVEFRELCPASAAVMVLR